MQGEIKRLVEQRKAGENNLTDEEIYAKVKPKGKRGGHDRHIGISPTITSLFGGFSESEKFRKEAEEAKIEASKAKKEMVEANEKNALLVKELEGIKKENKITRYYLEKFVNDLGYDLAEFDMEQVLEEVVFY